jgi:hypothetical protein
LPAGLEPGENYNLRVAFDAYFFKLFHYESRQPKEKGANPDDKQWHKAPLFLGKTIEVLGPVESQETFTSGMLAVVVGAIGGLLLTGVVLAIWFRRGDRKIQQASRTRIESQATFDDIPGQAGPVNRITDQY